MQRTGSRDLSLDTKIVESLGVLLVVLDRQGHILRFNRACEVLTGQAAGEVIGRRFWDTLILPPEISNAVAFFSRLTPGRFPYQCEYHWQSRSGELRLIAWRITALVDHDGLVTHIIACGHDITEERFAGLRFNAVWDYAPIGIVLASLDRRILSCTPAYERIVGYSEAELRAGIFPLATHPDDVARDMALFVKLAAGQLSTYEIEKRYVHKGGRIVQGHLTAALVRDTSGLPRSAIGLVQDVTGRKAAEAGRSEAQHQLALAEELLHHQQRELHRLSFGLSHQEWRILELLAESRTTNQIAGMLSIQTTIVRTNIHNIGLKLGQEVTSRKEIVLAARRHGLLSERKNEGMQAV